MAALRDRARREGISFDETDDRSANASRPNGAEGSCGPFRAGRSLIALLLFGLPPQADSANVKRTMNQRTYLASQDRPAASCRGDHGHLAFDQICASTGNRFTGRSGRVIRIA